MSVKDDDEKRVGERDGMGGRECVESETIHSLLREQPLNPFVVVKIRPLGMMEGRFDDASV